MSLSCKLKDLLFRSESGLARLIKRGAIFAVRLDTRFAKCRYGLNQAEREPKIIVSMTSYPERFSTMILPLKSLTMQTMKPDRIIVWLGSDSKPEDISEKMREYEQYGIEFRLDNTKNLKSHKKYYYAMQEFHDDLIITVDDDIIYPRNMIASLVKMHRRYPNAVCARRVHKITLDSKGGVKPYRQWSWEYRGNLCPASDMFATNGAGTLFAPDALSNLAFHEESIEKLCLNADDVWLWYMERLKGTKVVWVPCLLVHPPTVKSVRALSSLAYENVDHGGNDEYLENMHRQFGRNFCIGS